jgi:hypothetical protein
MPTLQPVDHDPFAQLAPVDHDPFLGTPAPSEYAQAKFNRIADAVIGGLRQWIETPGRAMREGITTEQAADWAAPTAFGMMGVGAPLAMTGAVPKGAVAGMFGGRLALTADNVKLARAEDMAARGTTRDSIWHETGWFKGADGEWRFEIPGDDRAGVFGLSPERQANSTQQIGEFSKEIIGKENRGLRYPDAIQHPELFDAYPWLVDRSTAVHPLEGGARGSLDRSSGIMRLDEKLDPWEARSVGLHELQHAIQGEEGFARGGSPSSFTQQADAKLARDAMSLRREFDALPSGMDRSAKENAIRENYKSLGIEDWLPSKESWDIAHDRIGNPDEALNRVIKLYNLDKSVTVASPHDVYRRVAGEVEARNVQARKDMTDYERKITPPWKTEDIPAADQVVIRNGDMQFGSMAPMDERAGSGYSLIPVDHDPFAPVQ